MKKKYNKKDLNKEYTKGYYEGYALGKDSSSDNLWPLMIAAFIVGILFVSCVIYFDKNNDMVNMRATGQILCKEQGMEYDRYEIICLDLNNDGSRHCYIPKIYCKQPEQLVELVDGIVVTYAGDAKNIPGATITNKRIS